MGKGHAAVVGASMAGLLAARVLAERVEHVTIIERDELPIGADARKGVPQARHAHGLLPSGENIVRQLFPGLIEELVDGGAQHVSTSSGRWWQCGGYRVAAPEAPDGTFFSRPFFERGVRARVEALPNVTFLRAAACGLAEEGGRVIGIDTEDRDNNPSRVPADIVVDASGRRSQATRWLTDLGYESPPVDHVNIDMTYASRLYERTPGRVPAGTWIVTISNPAESKRVGVAFPIEGDRWIVTLTGCHGERPPSDDAAYLAYAQSLPAGDIADILMAENPLGPVVHHRLPSSQWRHFEKVRRHPAGFVAIGDSICSFNPIYGQGMSSAAQQAMALGASIDAVGVDSGRLPMHFYKAAKKVIANPWAIAAGGDFAFPETTGPKPPGTDMINRYVTKVAIAAQHDPKVATALWNVQGLLAAPPALMRPSVAVRALRFARRGPTGAPSSLRPSPADAHAAAAR